MKEPRNLVGIPWCVNTSTLWFLIRKSEDVFSSLLEVESLFCMSWATFILILFICLTNIDFFPLIMTAMEDIYNHSFQAHYCFPARSKPCNSLQAYLWWCISFFFISICCGNWKDMYLVFFLNKILLLPLDVGYESAIRTIEISVHSNLLLSSFCLYLRL